MNINWRGKGQIFLGVAAIMLIAVRLFQLFWTND